MSGNGYHFAAHGLCAPSGFRVALHCRSDSSSFSNPGKFVCFKEGTSREVSMYLVVPGLNGHVPVSISSPNANHVKDDLGIFKAG